MRMRKKEKIETHSIYWGGVPARGEMRWGEKENKI